MTKKISRQARNDRGDGNDSEGMGMTQRDADVIEVTGCQAGTPDSTKTRPMTDGVRRGRRLI